MGVRPPTPPRANRIRWWALGAGITLIAAFFALGKTDAGIDVLVRDSNESSAGESMFWLASELLLLPAGLLVAWAFSAQSAAGLTRLHAWLLGLSSRARLRLVFLAAAIFAIASRAAHAVVLADFPVTDDETTSRFGGQVLALGKVMVQRPVPREAFPGVFFFSNGPEWTSFEFLGVQLAWAFSELTHTGPWIFALAAAVPVPFLAALIARRLGVAWGVLAVVLFVASPMMLSLSFTTHAHILSRAAIAASLYAYVRAEAKGTQGAWALFGLALGTAFMCRVYETTTLFAPLVLGTLWTAWRTGRLRTVLLGLIAGAAIPLAILALHAWAVTGVPWQLPRHGPSTIHYSGPASTKLWDPSRLWLRFGANSGYNFFLLCVWFLGPVGVGLAGIGAWTDAFTRRLALGVVMLLLVAMFHEHPGVHTFGPTHSIDTAMSLTVLAVHGAERVTRMVQARRIPVHGALSTLVPGIALSLFMFTGWNAYALRQQARIHETLYGSVATLHHAVVLAPGYTAAWLSIPPFKYRGTQVYHWRPTRPDYSDDVLILIDAVNVESSLRASYPDREFYRMRTLPQAPWVEVVPIRRPPT